MALPNAKILIHQVWTPHGSSGQAADIEIRARETLNLKRRLEEILSEHTGQELEKVSRDTDRDYFMSPQEAKEYGIIDTVITQPGFDAGRSLMRDFGVQGELGWRGRATATSSFSAVSAGRASGRSRS